MIAAEIKKNVHWVGAVDWDRRNFHGYSLSPKGTTYNAFLLTDEKTTLVDTVSAEFSGALLCNIAQVAKRVDYIVVNHVEPDHAGALARAVEALKPEKVFCSPMGEKAIREYFDPTGWPLTVVGTGDKISIGSRELVFVETRMLHWPDSMMTYCPQDKLLISSDAFGQNYATSERFADQVDQAELFRQAARYYANIVLPYSTVTLKILEQVGKLGWAIDMIAPDHGLVWRGPGVGQIIEAYVGYAKQAPTNSAVIVYDTMWHSTERMAEAIAVGLVEAGVSTKLMSLKANHHSDVMAEVFTAGAVLVGSPTHNNSILPLVAGMLSYMKGLKPQNKIGAAFGSYGWSGESQKVIAQSLAGMGFSMVDGLRVKNAPKHEHLKACVEFGRTVGQALKERLAKGA
jgi:flavorubredoxin